MRTKDPLLIFCFVFSFHLLIICNNSTLCSQNTFVSDTTFTVVLDTEQPKLLVDLMHYIMNTHGCYFSTNVVNPLEISELIYKNQKDTVLNRMIDELLAHPVFKYLSGIMQATADGTVVKGNEAYRTAFLSLPWREIDMSAGYISRLVEYFSRGNEDTALEIVNYISQNRLTSQDSVFRQVNDYLPAECRMNSGVTIYTVIDGNRGSFAEGNEIIMELTSYDRANPGLFLNTAAHEMHHVLYGNWLSMYYSDSGLTAAEKVIFDWQMRMLYEGSAQLLNYGTYSTEVKKLYINNSLIAELFDIWIDRFTNLYSSDNAAAEYTELRKYLYNTFAEELLKKYSAENYKELLSHRPTIDYYISYHIYKSICIARGTEGLNYVLLRPEELLSSYNESAGPKSILPRIPENAINIWKSVLQKSKKAR